MSRIPEPESEWEAEGLADPERNEASKDVTGDEQDGIVVPPDFPLEVEDYGTTAREQSEGEPLDLRVTREEPEVLEAADRPADDTAKADEPFPVDELKSGRLVAPDEGIAPDEEKDAVASDVGTDQGGFTAEERAIRVRPGGAEGAD